VQQDTQQDEEYQRYRKATELGRSTAGRDIEAAVAYYDFYPGAVKRP